MRKSFASSLLIVSGLIATGCAKPLDMPYSTAQQVIIKPTNAVFLMTLHLENTYRKAYQPDLLWVKVESEGTPSRSKKWRFEMDKVGAVRCPDKTKGHDYMVRMNLDPGKYIIRGVTGLAHGFPAIGTCFAPLHSELNGTTSGVFYLGHVEAVIRERKRDEFKAGPSIPPVDQALCGFSGGTFDISITDKPEDIVAFKAKFDQLRDTPIQKMMLPPFNREVAQQFWKTHW